VIPGELPPLPPAYERLGLTGAQHDSVRRAMARWEPRLDSVMRGASVALGALADSADAAMRAALTPEQRRTLDGMRTRTSRKFILQPDTKPH